MTSRTSPYVAPSSLGEASNSGPTSPQSNYLENRDNWKIYRSSVDKKEGEDSESSKK